MFEILKVYPELLGISIDENTAMLVNGNTFEVIGKSYVLIYDGQHWDQKTNQYIANKKGQERFHLLRKGRVYDMKKREVIK
jgi:cyanophycinase